MTDEKLKNDLKQLCTDKKITLLEDEEDFIVAMTKNLCNFIKEGR